MTVTERFMQTVVNASEDVLVKPVFNEDGIEANKTCNFLMR